MKYVRNLSFVFFISLFLLACDFNDPSSDSDEDAIVASDCDVSADSDCKCDESYDHDKTADIDKDYDAAKPDSDYEEMPDSDGELFNRLEVQYSDGGIYYTNVSYSGTLYLNTTEHVVFAVWDETDVETSEITVDETDPRYDPKKGEYPVNILFTKAGDSRKFAIYFADTNSLERVKTTFKVVYDPEKSGRYIIQKASDGQEIVKDYKTGYIWQKAYFSYVTWDEGKEACGDLKIAGYSWSLPTKEQLLSIVEVGLNPATKFPGMPASGFWTSVEQVEKEIATAVFFDKGLPLDYRKVEELNAKCIGIEINDSDVLPDSDTISDTDTVVPDANGN